MRYCFLFTLFSVLLSFSLHAEEDLEKSTRETVEILHQYWVENEDPIIKENSPFVKYRHFERLNRTEGITHSIGQFTYAVFKKEGKSIQELSQMMVEATGLLSALKREVGDATVYEAFQPKINRHVKMFFTEKEGNIHYSIASYRPGYRELIDIETEFLSRLLHEVDVNRKHKSLMRKFYVLIPDLIAKAYADPCDYCNGDPLCIYMCMQAGGNGTGTGGNGGLGIFGDMTQMNENIKELNGHLTDFKGLWGDSNGHWGDSNKNWGDSNKNWEQSNKNWEETNNEIKKTNQTMKDMLEEYKKSNEILDRQMTDANNTAKGFLGEYKRTNDIMEKMADPKNAFLLAGASAAGAVLGASAMNLAISGVTQLGTLLKKWITGEMRKAKDAELYEEFVKARKAYESSFDLAKSLEKSLDEVLMFHDITQKRIIQDPNFISKIEDTIIELPIDIQLDEEDLTKTKRQIKDHNYTEENCPGLYLQKYQQIKSIRQNKELLKAIKAMQPLLKKGSNGNLCKELRGIFTKLGEAEGVLFLARTEMLKTEVSVNRVMNDRWEKADDDLEKARKNKNARKVEKVQTNHKEEMEERHVNDLIDMEVGIQKDCKRFLRMLEEEKIKGRDRRHFCREIIYSDEFESSPSDFIKKNYPGIKVDQVKFLDDMKILDRVKQKKTFQRDQGVYGDWYIDIEQHEENTKIINPMLRTDPVIAQLRVKSLNAFFDKLRNEQAYLFTKDLKAKEKRINEICPLPAGK